MTTTTKANRPVKKEVPVVGRKALYATFGVLETASKRVAKFAHEGKKKLAPDGHTREHKWKTP